MKTTNVALTQINTNSANPRTITDDKFRKLVNSVLALPKMLELRPIVVNDAMVALGGNMRYRALTAIAEMQPDEINSRLAKNRDVAKKPAKAQEALRKYWEEWLRNPTAPVIKADDLTKAEQKEFIIKDNGDFGTWDYDALANEWNADDLCDWGVDVWRSKEVEDAFARPAAPLSTEAASILANEQDNDTPVDFGGALPPELQGADLAPAELPRIQGEDETPYDRVIIVYPKERKEELARLLGMAALEKVVYRLDELLGEKAKD